MKVGDAGEAFFVFETDEDVPQDLITSPILQATQPGQKNQDIEAGRFGTKDPQYQTLAQLVSDIKGRTRCDDRLSLLGTRRFSHVLDGHVMA